MEEKHRVRPGGCVKSPRSCWTLSPPSPSVCPAAGRFIPSWSSELLRSLSCSPTLLFPELVGGVANSDHAAFLGTSPVQRVSRGTNSGAVCVSLRSDK